MIPVKRIEIVVEDAHTTEVLDLLRKAGVPGYTVVRDVQGMGDRGNRMGDVLAGVFRNCYILVAWPDGDVEALVETLHPLLTRYGGLCLVSDAALIKHRPDA